MALFANLGINPEKREENSERRVAELLSTQCGETEKNPSCFMKPVPKSPDWMLLRLKERRQTEFDGAETVTMDGPQIPSC